MEQNPQTTTTQETNPTHGTPSHHLSSANMTRGDKHPQSQPMEQITISRTATQTPPAYVVVVGEKHLHPHIGKPPQKPP
ncbi:hypothetical protein QL285_047650 [Trifolium repens]|nr:hypothetical protein QL285_047650 [Trifolium repens]